MNALACFIILGVLSVYSLDVKQNCHKEGHSLQHIGGSFQNQVPEEIIVKLNAFLNKTLSEGTLVSRMTVFPDLHHPTDFFYAVVISEKGTKTYLTASVNGDGELVFARSSKEDYEKYQKCGSSVPDMFDDDEDEMGPELEVDYYEN